MEKHKQRDRVKWSFEIYLGPSFLFVPSFRNSESYIHSMKNIAFSGQIAAHGYFSLVLRGK